MYCYEDSKLLKLFATVVRILYDFDVLGEDTIKAWYKKGTQPKVRADELLGRRVSPSLTLVRATPTTIRQKNRAADMLPVLLTCPCVPPPARSMPSVLSTKG